MLDGAQALYPGPGRTGLLVPTGRSEHRVEAMLVSARGPGEWRFELSAGTLRPGSLRVVAGNVAAIGPAAMMFRLGGRVGERVVFTFANAADPPRPIGP